MSSAHHQLLAGYPWRPVLVGAARFDGVNDYMLRGGDLTGAADSKSGIVSAWVLCRDNFVTRIFQGDNSLPFIFEWQNINERFRVYGENAAGAQILELGTPNNSYPFGTVSSAWHHLLMSWDLADASKKHVYINDVSDLNSVTHTNDTLEYNSTNWAVALGDVTTFFFKAKIDIAELYVAFGQYLDFSVESNRRKFVTKTVRPVGLGSDGSLPTGTAPIGYFHLDRNEAVANFATNRGSGGNFTITGALELAPTSPSD